MTQSDILRNFDAAARHYDEAATAQALIAKRLVAWAAESNIAPASILDIGSGTGLVATEAQQRWPNATITALDAAPAMLQEARRKLPQLHTITGDILTTETTEKFNVLFSSMALHWLPDPRAALRRWQSWLKPKGKLFVALPVEGSFQKWRDLCREHAVSDGLWLLPSADFADDIAAHVLRENITIPYPSALDFLRSMKLTGAATPRLGYKPMNITEMRRLLSRATAPSRVFGVTYCVIYIELQGQC